MGDGKINLLKFQIQLLSSRDLYWNKQQPKELEEDSYECREVPDKVLTPAFLDLGSEKKSERIKAAKKLRGQPGRACILGQMSYSKRASIALQLLEDLNPDAARRVMIAQTLAGMATANLESQFQILSSEILNFDKEIFPPFDPAAHFLALVRVLSSMNDEEPSSSFLVLSLSQLAEIKAIVEQVLPELAEMLGQRVETKKSNLISLGTLPLTLGSFYRSSLSVPAIALLASAGEAAIPFLVKRYVTGKLDVRHDVIEAIRRMEKPQAKVAIKFFIGLLSDLSWLVRQKAIEALARLATPESHEVVPAVTLALQDENAEVRFEALLALQALARISPNAYLALPILQTVAANPAETADLRHLARGAIQAIEEAAL